MTAMTVPTMAELITSAIDTKLKDTHTISFGRIVKYYPITETADVQPQILRIVEDDEGNKVTEKYPILPHRPVVFYRAGGYTVTTPLEPGDFCILFYCEQSIDSFMARGDISDPGDMRMHGLQNAIVWPGCFPTPHKSGGAHPSHMVLGKRTGNQVHITETGVFIGAENATEPMVLGNKLKALFDSHTHSTSTGPSGPPIPGAVLSAQILSTKHKVDV